MKSDEKKPMSERPPHIRCVKCGALVEVAFPSEDSNEAAGGVREIKVSCPSCGHNTVVLFKR